MFQQKGKGGCEMYFIASQYASGVKNAFSLKSEGKGIFGFGAVIRHHVVKPGHIFLVCCGKRHPISLKWKLFFPEA